MDQEKALNSLEGIQEYEDEYIIEKFRYAQFYKKSNEATLDGCFTVEELEAIIFLCKEEKQDHDTKI